MNKYKEKITVIIPAYNVEKYVGKCIESVLNQTYKNLDIIIVNDGSTDSTSEILEQYAHNDKRIRLFHQKNQGNSAARNFALSITDSDFITFVDSDDWIDEKLIETLYSDLKKYDADISSTTHYYAYPNEKKCKESEKDKSIKVYSRNEALNHIILDEEIKSYPWAKLYKTKLFDGLKFPVGRIYEDYAFIYKLVAKSQKVVKRNEPLYNYLQLHSSLSKTDNVKHNYHFLLGLFERHDFVVSHPEAILNHEEYNNFFSKEVFYYLKRIIRLSKGNESKNEIQHAVKRISEFLKGNTKGVDSSQLFKLKLMVLFPQLYSMILGIKKKEKKRSEKLF